MLMHCTPAVLVCCCLLQLLAQLFSLLVPDLLCLVRKRLHETVATTNLHLVASCLNMMDALLRPYAGEAAAGVLGCSTVLLDAWTH